MEKAINPKNRGLGRGLNALFEDDETGFSDDVSGGAEVAAGRSRLVVGIERLEQSNLQPRKVFNDESIEELAESIRVHGLLQPILVRQSQARSDRYEIIAGERRWRAAQRAQLHEVPVIVLELSDIEALEIALIENLQREDLNPVDEAMGYKKLLDEYGHTQEQLAGALGKSRSHIANMVRLLTLPDVVLVYLERGDLSAGHARALITAEEPEELAREVVSKGLSVRQAERLAAEAADRPQKSRPRGGPSSKDTDTIALEREVSATLGMRVSIDSRDGQKGKVSVEFKTLDQLDDLLRRLSRD